MKNLSVLFALLWCISTSAQDLSNSRKTSYYTYIYRINDREAAKIYRHELGKVKESMLHTLIDSFPSGIEYSGRLPVGHYLKVSAEKNKLNFSITTVQNIGLNILNNHTDLCIQVFDSSGNLLNNAILKIKGKRLRFDRQSQAYLDKKSNRQGMVKVTYEGFTGYYDLKRQYNNPLALRVSRRLAYGTPLRYVWLPVRYTLLLPVDAVKSAVRGWPQGTVHRSINFFTRTYEKVACWFDDYYCDYNNGFENKHNGYLVFSKPKYLPGDTVKMKAFVVDRHGNPVHSEADIMLQKGSKQINLGSLKAYRPGGYSHSFVLHDSLDLELDRDYRISLSRNDRKKYISGTFFYEDYELSQITLSVKTDEENHYKNKEFAIKVVGKDRNDLNLQDARIELIIKPVEIHDFLGDHVFIPDTIYHTLKDLDPVKETRIPIPDSVFPEANLTYELQVILLTSDNDRKLEKKKIDYYHLKKEFGFEPVNDSICLSYLVNGMSLSRKTKIFGVDNFGNKTMIRDTLLPARIVLNPYYARYLLKADSLEQSFPVKDESPLIVCFTERTMDSLKILVENPRHLPFNYNVYAGNREQYRGHAQQLFLHKGIHTRRDFFLSLQYLWGGEMMYKDYRIPLREKDLTLEVSQPGLVVPGQKATIQLMVRDKKGQPVEGVDLTAFGITSKFDCDEPEVPYLGKSRKNKSIVNNFNFIPVPEKTTHSLPLDYERWCALAHLDTIEYYRFIYPGNAVYTHVDTLTEPITQFSPFVITGGNFRKIHIIYVDLKPVYFAWSTNVRPYSFRVDSGYHQVKLRTRDKLITVDSLYFPFRKKLVFSLSDTIHHTHVTIEKTTPELTSRERLILYNYVFPYSKVPDNTFAYLEQNDEVTLLKPVNNYVHFNMTGPVTGSSITFHVIGGYDTGFKHEPFYQYEFNPGLLKMRDVNPDEDYPKWLGWGEAVENPSEVVFTPASIEKAWKSYTDNIRFSNARYQNPEVTRPGNGTLLVEYDVRKGSQSSAPLNVLLLRYDEADFIRVYPGNTMEFHDLREGSYKLVFFFPGSDYHVVDSVQVVPGGISFYKLLEPVELKHDAFSISVSRIIETNLFKPASDWAKTEVELKKIYDEYLRQFRYRGVGKEVEGYVYEEDTHEPLPGVNVVIEGTSMGTVTDINGFFYLNVPDDADVLTFNYVGYASRKIPRPFYGISEVLLQPEVMCLQEVVVVGYGVSRKSDVTGSVATVTSTGIPGLSSNLAGQLQGKLSGISIEKNKNNPGSVTIRIRGVSSESVFNQPLYVVDGMIYNGDISQLRNEFIDDITILKGAESTAIYGSRGSNGVILITTKKGTFTSTEKFAVRGADYDPVFLDNAQQSASIRKNFSDHAFWQPRLVTDEYGRASFSFIVPDDLTSWDTRFLAMNSHKQTGSAKGTIKSYKPLMAKLAMPGFLIQGDTLRAIGKVLNYTPDTIEVTSQFEVNDSLVFSRKKSLANSYLDTLTVIAKKGDTLLVKYYTRRDNGYFDGELRKLPMLPVGLEETRGSFHVLNADTSLHLRFDRNLGTVFLSARADVLDIIEEEVSRVIAYQYNCNEQLASKLKALLAEKKIREVSGKSFNREFLIMKLIRLLEQNQKEKDLWGWWKDSGTSYWISAHVLEALLQAEQMGYSVKVDKGQVTDYLVWKLQSPGSVRERISLVKILRLISAPVDYPSYIRDIEKARDLSLNDRFDLIELKQLCGLKPDLKILLEYQHETLFGNLYFSTGKDDPGTLANDLQATLAAYRMLSRDSVTPSERLVKIRNYFLETRMNGYWRNTYESAQIIETILPDLLNETKEIEKPVLTLTGKNQKIMVREFPFEVALKEHDSISIHKKGSFPVYLTAFQHSWNYSPVTKSGDFSIHTRIGEISDAAGSAIPQRTTLKAGQPIKLIAEVTVRKDAEYVMIEVPVPAGCSYTEKHNNFPGEVHREYFKDRTLIFCERLPKGDYKFEIALFPRYTGKYTMNPSRIELMYFPVFNANNEVTKVIIE